MELGKPCAGKPPARFDEGSETNADRALFFLLQSPLAYSTRPMRTPTRKQLSPVSEDLDGRIVVEHLFGKSVEDAVALLEENSAYYQEDYTWMGPKAFCYYCPALVRYLRSPASRDDSLFAYFMLSTFRLRLDQDGASIASAIPCIEEFCALVESDSERLGFDDNSLNALDAGLPN